MTWAWFWSETCAGTWLESCRPSEGFCVCVPPFLGLASKWHEAIWHVWSLTKSCVQAPLLQMGETKNTHKKKKTLWVVLLAAQKHMGWVLNSVLFFLKKSMTISPSLNICTCTYTSSPASPMHNHQQELDTGYSHHSRMVQPWTEATSSQYNHREVSGLGLHRDIRDISCEPPNQNATPSKKMIPKWCNGLFQCSRDLPSHYMLAKNVGATLWWTNIAIENGPVEI